MSEDSHAASGSDARGSRNTLRSVNGRTGGPLVDSALGHAVDRVELPIALVDLSDFTVIGASESARRLVAGTTESIIGRAVSDLYAHENDAEFLAPLRAMRRRDIDFFRAHRAPANSQLTQGPITTWVRAVDFGDERYALVEFALANESPRSPIDELLGRDPHTMTLGFTDESWIVTAISSDVRLLLGLEPQDLVGRGCLDWIHPDDVDGLREADRFVNARSSVARAVRMRSGSGEWRRLCFVLTALATANGRCFILLHDPDPAPTAEVLRVAQLEGHLRRISAEVEASGVLQNVGTLPDSSQVAHIGELSTRQWEVLARLLRGERVPLIAKSMFISQSTVRNHLSAIFERFGVHSQAQLLALFVPN